MSRDEEIRYYLSNLSKLDLANSVYLFKLDFMKCSMEVIISSIVNLYVEVNNLKEIIETRLNDKSLVLTKEEAAKQVEIFKDYAQKSKVLDKVLANDVIYDTVITGIVEVEKAKLKK